MQILLIDEMTKKNLGFPFRLAFKSYIRVVPPPRIPVANEGLGWDPLLKT